MLSNLAFALFLLIPTFAIAIGGNTLLSWLRMPGGFGNELTDGFDWKRFPPERKLYAYFLVALSTTLGILVLVDAIRRVAASP